jgi:hypothetical protein
VTDRARRARRPRRARIGRPVGCAIAGVIALAAAQGCGVADRPPPLADERIDVGDASGAQLSVEASVPMCSLGPEGGVCACADEPLIGDVPNIYFVLDRSGSMAEMNKWGTVQTALDQLAIALGPRAAIGAAVFPNPASDECSAGVQVFATERGNAPAGKAGRVVNQLSSVLARIPAAGGTPTASTLRSILPNLVALPGKTYVILATDGGPNCNAAATCGVDTCTFNIDNPACSPGGLNCCTDPGSGAEGCLDSQPTIDAVQAIAAAGIPVYVVGVPGSAPYADLLDTLARTGGTARAGEPQYYAIDTADQSALATALSGIAAQITGTCTLTLDSAPPAADLVNVFLDEQALPQSGPDGWTLDGSTVTITGASCQSILQGNVLDVRVVAGCPTVAF